MTYIIGAAIGLALALYLLPTSIAAARNHHNQLAIFALNTLLGWTFIGWALALVWACTSVQIEVRHG